MPTPTPELGLQKALDADDTADYLDTSLANSLTTIDSLFSNTSGHTHGGVHQGAPIGSIPASAIPAGSIDSSKIADGAIQSIDLADGSVTTAKIAAGAVTSSSIADGTIQGADIAGNTITSDKIAVFASGPFTTDWFRNNSSGGGIYNTVAALGIGFDTGGAFMYPSGDRLITGTAVQTLTNKTETNMTLAGTTYGAPVWASGQTFPTLTCSGALHMTQGQQLVWGSNYGIFYDGGGELNLHMGSPGIAGGASAGSVGLPSQCRGFLQVNITGTGTCKIPLYNN